MSEEELDSKEEDFQQKMIEFMMSAKTQFEAMNGQMQKLAEGMRAAEKRLELRINKAIDKEDSEEAILEEGFKSYSFSQEQSRKTESAGRRRRIQLNRRR